MIEIYCAYSGSNWTKYQCVTLAEAKDYLETLRPAEKRPSHLIFCNCDAGVYDYALTILWTPQHFYEFEGTLYGGMQNTRKYFERLLPKIKQSAILL